MPSAISSATYAPPVVQPASTPSNKPGQAQPKPATSTDSVQISSAAQAAVALLQEVRELPYQTTQEARGGDHQAQRLLAQEAAAHPVTK
jgi:hypothetical protein